MKQYETMKEFGSFDPKGNLHTVVTLFIAQAENFYAVMTMA